VFKRDKLFTPRRASDSAIVFQIAAAPSLAGTHDLYHFLPGPTVLARADEVIE